jgi:hypothetical protein
MQLGNTPVQIELVLWWSATHLRIGDRSVAASDSFKVQGHVSRGFEPVRDVFIDNFVRRRELGGACCAFHRGEKVIDLWGGIRNKHTAEPWEQDTIVVVHSATKV